MNQPTDSQLLAFRKKLNVALYYKVDGKYTAVNELTRANLIELYDAAGGKPAQVLRENTIDPGDIFL